MNHTGHHIDSVYIYNNVPLTTTTLPAVRVVHGSILPRPGGSIAGFTVATPFPMYVWGDYNSQDSTGSSLGLQSTTHTYPAALMADSITILSDSWQDANSTFANILTDTSGGPTPSSTTVNAAILEGIVQSDPTISGDYSGGVENFLRLLENWNPSSPLTYNGSIVVLFYSQYATNHWRPTGNYYDAPVRRWAYDLNFQSASKLPPLTPQVVNLVTP